MVVLVAAGAAAQQPQAQPPAREFTLANETELAIREFYATPSGAPSGTPDRAGDRLGADTIPAGETYRIRLGRTRDCVFDLRVVFLDDSVEERRRVDVCRNARITFGDPALPRLEVEVANASRVVLRELYASVRGPEAWGPDRLGADVLPAGESMTIRLRSRDCTFQIRAVWEDSREEVLEGRDLCASRRLVLDRASVPRPPARPLVMANRHLATVQEVYVTSSAQDDWGPDRLGASVLAAGSEVALEVEGECAADIRIVFPNGGAEERREVDICASPRIVLRPGWVLAERLEEEGAVTPVPGLDAASGGLRLRNAGPLPIVEIYADPPGAPRGQDRLGASVLGLGEVLELLPPRPEACAADLLAVFRDGREVRRAGLDLCTGEEIEIQ